MKAVILIHALGALLVCGAAYAGGNNNDGCQGNCPQGGGATATAVQGQIQGQAQGQKQGQGQAQSIELGNITAGGGGGATASADVDTRAYGGGSTGLTSTARCLGSMSVGFNAFATTYTVPHCVLMTYAEMICKTDPACWKRVALVDENLTDEQRAALGIASPSGARSGYDGGRGDKIARVELFLP